jgi:hypothetical protein
MNQINSHVTQSAPKMAATGFVLAIVAGVVCGIAVTAAGDSVIGWGVFFVSLAFGVGWAFLVMWNSINHQAQLENTAAAVAVTRANTDWARVQYQIAPPQTQQPQQAQLPEPSRLVKAGANQFVAVTPTDDQRIDQLAQAILTRCFSVNPSQANVEARIQMRADGILRSHSDITLAMQKLFALGWVSKESSAKTARWLWRNKQNGNELIDFDHTTPFSLA